MTEAVPVGAFHRRVTVVAPRARLDISLPAQSTVAELVPVLASMADAATERPSERPALVGGWVLSRFGSPPLDPGHTVASAAIRDGEVLYLAPHDQQASPLLFDDVVDAIANAADSEPGAWRPAASRRAGLAVATLAFVAAAVLLVLAGLPWPRPAVSIGGMALALLLAAGALARAYGDAAAGAAVAAGGLPCAGLAGLVAVDTGGTAIEFGAGQLALAGAAMTVYAVLVAVLVTGYVNWYIGAAVAASIGGAACVFTALLGAQPEHAAAVTTALVTMFSPAVPMLAMRIGRIPLPSVPTDVASFRGDERPTLGQDVVDETRTAEGAVTGLLAAVAAVVFGCAVVLLNADGRWPLTLTVVTGAVLLFRARFHNGVGQRIVLLCGGSLVLLAATVDLAVDGSTTLRLTLVGGALFAGVLSAAYGARVVGRDRSPYWGRLLDVVEFLLLLSVVPIAAAVLGIYATVRSFGG